MAQSKSKILLGANKDKIATFLLANMANRHGIISGATGTGKTITLQILAEELSSAGVPVFLTDVKGDISGLASTAQLNEKLLQRANRIGIDNYQSQSYPVVFWDLYGKLGHPLHTTIWEGENVNNSNLSSFLSI